MLVRDFEKCHADPLANGLIIDMFATDTLTKGSHIEPVVKELKIDY